MGESENKRLLNKCINIISKKLNKLKLKSKILIIAGSDSSEVEQVFKQILKLLQV